MTLLHLVAVSAYLIVGCLVYDNVLNELFYGSKFNENKYLILCIFDQLIQAIAQICLLIIFLNLGTASEARPSSVANTS